MRIPRLPYPFTIMSLDNLPAELIEKITSNLDQPSLASVVRTARFLREESERFLYHSVQFYTLSHTGDLGKLQTDQVRFLETIANCPSLGRYVIDLAVDGIGGKFKLPQMQLMSRAFGSMVNLKSFKLHFASSAMLNATLHPITPPSFTLTSLEITSATFIPSIEILIPFLRTQLSIRHLIVPSLVDSRRDQGEGREFDFRGTCPHLESLEGDDAIMRTMLPGRKIKSIRWMYHPGNSITVLDPHDTASWMRPPFGSNVFNSVEDLALNELTIIRLPYIADYLVSLTHLEMTLGTEQLRYKGTIPPFAKLRRLTRLRLTLLDESRMTTEWRRSLHQDAFRACSQLQEVWISESHPLNYQVFGRDGKVIRTVKVVG